MPIVNSFSNGSARGLGWSGLSGPNVVVTWSPLPAGTPFTTGAYSGVDFTASATVTITGVTDVEYVVVAGGGGGGESGPGLRGAGGGGAGGMLTGTLVGATGPYPVVVGAGGASSTSGSPSYFSPLIFASRGGRGGDSGGNGTPGGSGGGAGNDGSPASKTGGASAPGQGNPGGDAFLYSPFIPISGSGGGGGAGAAGGDAFVPPSTNWTGVGGNGLATSIKGTPITLAGGGGAGIYNTSNATLLPGGSGGGGNGALAEPAPSPGVSSAATAGAVNTGGGGGGATSGSPVPVIGPVAGIETGAAGGSGRVIIRWLA